MKYILSGALMYLTVAAFGVGGWLASLLIGADHILIPAAVLSGVALGGLAMLATEGDIWALFPRGADRKPTTRTFLKPARPHDPPAV